MSQNLPLKQHCEQLISLFIKERLHQGSYFSSEKEIAYHKPNFVPIQVNLKFINWYIHQYLLGKDTNKDKDVIIKIRDQLLQGLKEMNMPIINDTNQEYNVKRFVVLSDIHSKGEALFPKIPNGDVILCCGDFSNRGSLDEISQFNDFLGRLKISGNCKTIICISGNHDYGMDAKYNKNLDPEKIFNTRQNPLLPNCDYYLQNNSIILDSSIKIYGSPITSQGMAFHSSNSYSYWKEIDSDSDIVLSHTPPFNILDLAWVKNNENPKQVCKVCGNIHDYYEHWGDYWLKNQLIHRVKPNISVFGHVHDDQNFVRKSIKELKAEEEYQQKLFNIEQPFDSKTSTSDDHIITFLNGALDLTHKVYFFDYFYIPNSRSLYQK
ncbi:predicted protein [Naegleria gruberi]|uniref:Predicted protein n=1 Tax=Naegleria gruberi TaxID=5762 RepID=D2V517_NAEGR|nr:uncharacterized protein NAEGRDRAFT_63982 [Naegleria gruberi]EFC48203.1 predicted protein [Naegleria gruberi]|eukprot:XP_002680947.1 predicted protein [Naegleria gruberi strain NEG-M]